MTSGSCSARRQFSRIRVVPASGICDNAQTQLARTMGSSSFVPFSNAGIELVSRWFAITMAALRSRPRRFARHMGVRRKRWRNCFSSIQKRSSSVNGLNEATGSKASSMLCGACRFQGQTAWQISQPKAQDSIPSRRCCGMTPGCSIVR